MTPEQESLRGQLAATRRHHPDDTAKADELTRALKASRLGDYIKTTVEAMPPLTSEQRTRLAVLLLVPETGAVA